MALHLQTGLGTSDTNQVRNDLQKYNVAQQLFLEILNGGMHMGIIQ